MQRKEAEIRLMQKKEDELKAIRRQLEERQAEQRALNEGSGDGHASKYQKTALNDFIIPRYSRSRGDASACSRPSSRSPSSSPASREGRGDADVSKGEWKKNNYGRGVFRGPKVGGHPYRNTRGGKNAKGHFGKNKFLKPRGRGFGGHGYRGQKNKGRNDSRNDGQNDGRNDGRNDG